MLDSILQRVGKLSQVMVWIGGALLIFAAFMTTIDVIARKLFGWTFGGADEIAGYMFAISTGFAMAFALLQRTHVRIDALYLVLPARVRTVLDIFAFLMMASFLGFITERAYSVWINSYESSSVSVTPMVTHWPSRKASGLQALPSRWWWSSCSPRAFLSRCCNATGFESPSWSVLVA